jgi:RNA polymerase sigma-70 factor (ECF subfamily)
MFTQDHDGGTAAVLAAWYQAYGRGMFGYVYSLLGTREDAEDVVQTVFVTLARLGGDRVAAIRHPKTYLCRMARNEAYRLLTARGKEPATPLDMLVNEPRAENNVGAWIDATGAAEALNQLDPLERDIVLMNVYDAMTFREIARVTGRLLPTVATKYYRAMNKLRLMLKDSHDHK